jgi:hypothetical protein
MNGKKWYFDGQNSGHKRISTDFGQFPEFSHLNASDLTNRIHFEDHFSAAFRIISATNDFAIKRNAKSL